MMYGLTPFTRNAFSLFNALDELDKDFFSGSMSTNVFRTDITDAGEKYIMESELPGFEKEDIKIDISGDYITISAQHKTDDTKKDENCKYIRRERSYGSFKRSFGISDVNAEEISAEYKNGVLTIELPKKKPEEPFSKSLEIK
ncbi:MAG: Hsp20/alpha crystallin family protein [Ruminococcus flavefaciens]|nr:Hsp20/alpha crystallin family protein [Ruminococcus flavefaciens]MCM1228499.1 Hsp20/alpha crystallin family protein [Ruminococcus flavefaciens]